MNVKLPLVLPFVFFLFLACIVEAQTDTLKKEVNVKETTDMRQFVSMPDKARDFIREDMIDHLSTINQIIGYLATNKLDKAADIAESKLGLSSMGKHRASGMGPGRFMPNEMRNLGINMHGAASEFSLVANRGDVIAAYAALQNVTNNCVACHYSYRTR